VYAPWVEAFFGNGTHPRLNRGGLQQRLNMLLALELSLAAGGAARSAACVCAPS
jgi:hypothetical protein